MRGFGVLFVSIVVGCASPEGAQPGGITPTQKGPECGHGALDADPHNCGECGHDCTQLTGVSDATCFQGTCRVTCESGRAHCSSNPDDGCEADLSSPSTCGACSTSCNGGVCAPSGGGFACQSSCTSGTDCGGQCVDSDSDSANCGTCGHACSAPQNGSAACDAGSCALTCNAGFALQNGVCVSTQPATPTWQPVDSGSFDVLYGVWGAPNGDIFVTGDKGTVLEAPAGGAFDWIFSYTSNDIQGVWGTDSDHVLSVGWSNFDKGGAVFRPQSDGSWDGKGIFTYTLSGTWGTDFNHVYIVGDSGTILHATDGHTWGAEGGTTTQHLWSVWGSSEDNVFAAGNHGTVLHKKSGAWAAEKTGVTDNLYGVWGASASDIWAVGANGTVLHSTGDGTWSAEPSGTTHTLYNVGGFGSDVYAVGGSGTILHRSGTWAAEASGVTDDLYGVWGSAMDGVFAVGDNGVIVHK